MSLLCSFQFNNLIILLLILLILFFYLQPFRYNKIKNKKKYYFLNKDHIYNLNKKKKEKDIDTILDKISKHGINKITKKDLKKIKK
jgi:hypothetical protein